MTSTLTREEIGTKADLVFNRRPKTFWYSLIGICLFVLVPEVLFGITGVGEQDNLCVDPVLGFASMERKPVTNIGEGYSRSVTNSFGMPDFERSLSKPANVFRIAVVGDSMTQAFEVQREENYCQRMEKTLNSMNLNKKIEVLNFGVSGYNLGQMYLMLKYRVMRFSPDLVILPLRVGTVGSLKPDPALGFVSVRPYFTVDASGQLVQDNSVQQKWSHSFEARRMQSTDWLRRHSHIWGVISKCMGSYVQFQNKLERGARKAIAFAQKIYHPDLHQQIQESEPPSNLQSTANALIKAMKSECDSRNCAFLMIRFPGHEHIHDDVETENLMVCADQLKVPLLDVTSQFDSIKSGTFYVSHFTPLGHRLIAESLVPFIDSHFILPKSGQSTPIPFVAKE